MTIRANNTHIIFNDATTQSTGNVITRVISTGAGYTMIASVADGVVTLKTILATIEQGNATNYFIGGNTAAPPPPVGE